LLSRRYRGVLRDALLGVMIGMAQTDLYD
jgi:hypothetical protein